jgi:glutamate/tyrosine decarboxylase-like PLP-dependent enzyme
LRGNRNPQDDRASVAERMVLRWLAEMAGYPPGVDGVLVNGVSLATTYALVAACGERGRPSC